MAKKQLFFMFVIGLATITTGFFRDYIFRSINALLGAWDSGIDYPIHSNLTFLKNYSYDSVIKIKWVLTVLFSLLFLILLIAALKILFNNNRYYKIAILSYFILFGVSGIMMSIGYMIPESSDHTYEFSRFLMGMAQSPMVLMILVPIFLFAEKQQTKNPD